MSTLLPIITVLLIYGIIYLVKNKKKDKLLEEKPQGIISFEIDCEIEKCFFKLKEISTTSKYIIESIDDNAYSIVLGENMTLMTNGFYYPIYLTMVAENTTQIEVGIKSKSLQVGPLVEKSHQDFVNQLKVALLADISEN